MTKYKAKISFTDLEDGGRVYLEGDTYPRDGYAPSDERIAYLAGSENKAKKPVIAAVKPPAPKKPPTATKRT